MIPKARPSVEGLAGKSNELAWMAWFSRGYSVVAKNLEFVCSQLQSQVDRISILCLLVKCGCVV